MDFKDAAFIVGIPNKLFIFPTQQLSKHILVVDGNMFNGTKREYDSIDLIPNEDKIEFINALCNAKLTDTFDKTIAAAGVGDIKNSELVLDLCTVREMVRISDMENALVVNELMKYTLEVFQGFVLMHENIHKYNIEFAEVEKHLQEMKYVTANVSVSYNRHEKITKRVALQAYNRVMSCKKYNTSHHVIKCFRTKNK